MIGTTDQLVTAGVVADRLGISLSGLKKWEAVGAISPPMRVLGSNDRVWKASDIPHLEQQAAEHRARIHGRRRPALAAA